MGYDSDAPEAAGEVGKVGVAIDSLADMEVLLGGIDLASVTTSMTINATATILLAMYLAVARKQGVEEQILAAGMEVISEYSDWNETVSSEIAQNTLTANPDLDAIFVAFDPGAVAVLSVLRQKDLVDDIILVGFDGLPVGLEAIAAGEMNASVKQDNVRMGAEGVELAVKIINGESVPDFIPIDGILITEDNVSDFME